MAKPVNLIDRRIDKTISSAAFEALSQALAEQGCEVRRTGFWQNSADALQILVGEADSPLVEQLHRLHGFVPQNRAEGIFLHRCVAEGNKLCVVSGSDAVGLAYALYDCAAQVQSSGPEALAKLSDREEYPETRQRGVDRYVMSHLDEEWWLSEEFWQEYLPRLQACRFNKFTLITGFDTSYLTPPYPYFVEVEGFEAVKVQGLNAGQRKKNRAMLQTISQLCARHGIEFCFGSWQQAPWTESQQSRITGLPTQPEAFGRYCAQGMAQLLKECPFIRTVQLRVNMESGMSTGEETGDTNTDAWFWCRMMDAMAGVGRPVRVEIRAKGATDQLLRYAAGQGLDVCVATKYWCEHMPLPYHIPMLRAEERQQPNNMNCGRRYSYGDLLRKPHWYRMLYRLWNYGSANLFLWGSAEYVQRFAQSLPPFEGDGFTINAPLALKGGMEDVAAPEPWRARIGCRSVTEEDQRYWAMYSAFGLIGYNAQSGQQAYRRLFSLRFGGLAPVLYQLYETASMVLPLITTVHFPVHPSLHYWPELYPGAALFGENNAEPLFGAIDYASALPSDEALFYSIATFAEDTLQGVKKPKYTPEHTRAWLHTLACTLRQLLAQLPAQPAGELAQAAVDFSMLANLAEFHARKAGAALHLKLFQLTGQPAALQTAHADMQLALGEWRALAQAGQQHYNPLQFNAGTGTRRCGSWAERLELEVEPDAHQLQALLQANGLAANGTPSPIKLPKTMPLQDDTPAAWPQGVALPLCLRAPGLGEAQVQLHYRHTNHMEGEYLSCPMERGADGYKAVIPADYLGGEFDLIVYYTVVDEAGKVFLHPGVGSSQHPMPYYVVKITGGQQAQ